MADLNNPKVQKILHSKTLAYLATLGSQGEPQSSPMWFLWDGEYIKFTHTSTRQKYQNIQRDPRVSISIADVLRETLTLSPQTLPLADEHIHQGKHPPGPATIA